MILYQKSLDKISDIIQLKKG